MFSLVSRLSPPSFSSGHTRPRGFLNKRSGEPLLQIGSVNDSLSPMKPIPSLAAFALTADASRDAALIATLAPGSYTAQISGVGNTTGVALVEVYELP